MGWAFLWDLEGQIGESLLDGVYSGMELAGSGMGVYEWFVVNRESNWEENIW